MFLFLSPLTFFGLPLFLFLFLCLCLSLVFLSSFLSFFLLSFCFLFLSLFHFSFFFAFVSWKEQHEHFQLQFLFSWNIFSFFWFPVLLFLSNPFFLSLLSPDFKLHPIFQLLHPYSNFFELIRIRHYITVTLQYLFGINWNYVIPNPM